MAESAEANSGLEEQEMSMEMKQRTQEETTDVKACEDRCPSEIELAKIAQAIGSNWESLAIELDINSPTIEQIKEDNATSVQRIFKVLSIWKNTPAHEATFGNLYAAMHKMNFVTIDWQKLPGMPHNDSIPNDKELSKVAQTIGDNWEPLARKLGIDSPCIDQIKMDNDSSINQARKMLETWRQTQKQQATVECLYSALGNVPSKLKGFLKDLLRHYRDVFNQVPIVDGINSSVLDFYAEPTLEIVTRSVVDHGVSRMSKPVTSYRDIFLNASESCRYIYVTAHAGFGKTTFAKRLCMLWCEEKENNESLTQTDRYAGIEPLNEYDFLFLITLRNALRSECYVEKMIFTQIVSKLSEQYDKSFFESVLRKNKCLIVLDGLDEWSHPKETECQDISPIPHRISASKSPFCCYLSTTRSWKMTEVRMEHYDIDKQLEITGFEINQREALISNVIKKIMPTVTKDERKKKAKTIIEEITNKGLFEREPVVLIYLTCVWLDDKTIGETKSDIFSNIIKYILTRGERKINKLNDSFFKERLHGECEHHSGKHVGPGKGKFCCLLRNLGNLAFSTLCPSNKLAIDSEEVESMLSENELECLLKMGLLIKDMNSRLTGDILKYSFIHKTFQEFFCAYHLVNLPTTEDCVSEISEVCPSLISILSYENIFIYLTGLNSGIFRKLSEKLCRKIVDDKLCKDHRNRIRPWFDERHEQTSYTNLYHYQSMYVKRIQESNARDINIYLEDIFLNKVSLKCGNEPLQTLLDLNEAKLKSVSVVNLDIGKFHQSMQLFEENQFEFLERFDLYGEMGSEDLNILLSRCTKSLKCLSLCSYKILPDESTATERIPFSIENLQSLQKMVSIKSLTLECFFFTHGQLDILTKLLGEKVQMKEIRLMSLNCSDHDCGCTGFTLDLSKHNYLQSFELDNVPVSQINMNVASLDECLIGEGLLPGVVSSIAESLSGANSMGLFTLCNLKCPAEVKICLEKLQKMTNLYQLMLKKIDFSEIDISFYIKYLAKLQVLWLFKSNMPCANLYKIKEQVKEYTQSFRIKIDRCEITPSTDFEQFKQSIINDRETFRVSKNIGGRFFFEKYEDV